MITNRGFILGGSYFCEKYVFNNPTPNITKNFSLQPI